MSELVTEIRSNSIDHAILQSRSKLKVMAEICGIKGQQIIISIYGKSENQVRESYKNQKYDISFELNRSLYQLQHYALDFVEQHGLYIRYIENSAYRCRSPAVVQLNHDLK